MGKLELIMGTPAAGRYVVDSLATEVGFDEAGYLIANPDVAAAVRNGSIESGWKHFLQHGRAEGRRLRRPSLIRAAKLRKLSRIRPLLRSDMPCVDAQGTIDFLTE